MKRIVLVVVLMLTAGCHTTPSKSEQEKTLAKQLEMEAARRRLHYLEENPELSPAIRRAIGRGEVIVGMSESDVRASIGEPDQIATTETEHGSREQWYYRTGAPGKEYLDFDDGTLRSWQPDR